MGCFYTSSYEDVNWCVPIQPIGMKGNEPLEVHTRVLVVILEIVFVCAIVILEIIIVFCSVVYNG